jgi:hypothetical protein
MLGRAALLLVVALDASVARWCAQPIELGHPGFMLRPLVAGRDASGRPEGRTPMMNEQRRSDRLVVPKKLPNKASGTAAEVVEGRSLAKGKVGEQYTPRTQSRTQRAQCARLPTPSSSAL